MLSNGYGITRRIEAVSSFLQQKKRQPFSVSVLLYLSATKLQTSQSGEDRHNGFWR